MVRRGERRFVPIADIALFGRRLHCRSSVNIE